MSINELRGLYPFSSQDVLNVTSQLKAIALPGIAYISSNITPSLTIQSTTTKWPSLVFNCALTGTATQIVGRRGNTLGNRWSFNPGNSVAESGNNNGSWLGLNYLDDTGSNSKITWQITRTGTENHYHTWLQLAHPNTPFSGGFIRLQGQETGTMPIIYSSSPTTLVRYSPSICIGTTDNMPTIATGAGVPTAASINSSLYFRTDGTVGARMYVKQANAGTVWAAVAGV
jgi:hypothetical protein